MGAVVAVMYESVVYCVALLKLTVYKKLVSSYSFESIKQTFQNNQHLDIL